MHPGLLYTDVLQKHYSHIWEGNTDIQIISK